MDQVTQQNAALVEEAAAAAASLQEQAASLAQAVSVFQVHQAHQAHQTSNAVGLAAPRTAPRVAVKSTLPAPSVARPSGSRALASVQRSPVPAHSGEEWAEF